MAKNGPDWLDEDDLFDDDEGGVFEEDGESSRKPSRGKSPKGGRGKPEKKARESSGDEVESSGDGEKKQSLAARLAARKKRPGEQEILKSPFVLTLAAGAKLELMSRLAGRLPIGKKDWQR